MYNNINILWERCVMLTYKQNRILCFAFMLIMAWRTEIALAFTDMSIEKLDKELSKLMQEAQQGNKKASNRLKKALEILYKVDISKHSQEEIITELQSFAKEGKIPSYFFDKRGQYMYVENNNLMYLVGTNIRLRSQPNTQAKIITTLNTETTDYLTYLGEWKNPKGERWVLAINSLNNHNSGELGWIYGKYVILVPNTKIQSMITRYKNPADNTNVEPRTIPPSQDITNDDSINWGYVFWGILALGIAYVVTSHVLEWEFNIENFCAFLAYAFCTIAVIVIVCAVAYVILKFIWEKIILPILAGLFLLFGLIGGGDSGSNYSGNNETSNKSACCEYPNREYCRTCPLIDFSKESEYFSGYYWCRDHRAYVDPDYDAEYNSENLKYS